MHLGRSTAEGVALAVRQPAGFPPHSRLLSEITQERTQNNPGELARLVAHLLSGTELPFYEYRISEVLAHLRKHSAAVSYLHLIEENALRLGIELNE